MMTFTLIDDGSDGDGARYDAVTSAWCLVHVWCRLSDVVSSTALLRGGFSVSLLAVSGEIRRMNV